MIKLFDLSGISKSPSIFDTVKLSWLNGEYIKDMDEESYYAYAEKFLQQSKVYGKYDHKLMLSLLKTRIETFGEIPQKLDFLEEFGDFDVNIFTHKKMKTDLELTKQVLPLIKETLENIEFTHDSLHDSLISLAQSNGYKNGQILWPARIAITGQESTPGGAIEMALILGKEECIKRINHSIYLLNK
jgi:glutamyl-tRNA synthetase